ncbi:MAG: type II secretion system F family protein [Verrucomicrobiia bacterium]|jgi:type IV pilus assembly protein PilC
MNLDEFAFFNQQLAAMLRTGIPLESALGQLCASMRRGELRDELEKLRADLANGTPFQQALAARKLPPFYVQMLTIGAKSNDLPGVLTLVADYYQSANLIWTRLKGLMVYPAIVLVASLALSILLAGLFGGMLGVLPKIFSDVFDQWVLPAALTEFSMRATPIGLWLPVVVLAVLCVAVGVVTALPRLQSRLRWRLPGFREASLWQVASAMEIMLKGGCSLDDTIGLMAHLERDSAVAGDLAQWRARLASGHGDFAGMAAPTKRFPPLFIWLVASARSDLASGLKRAAEIYHARAEYRTEILLQAALPVSVLVLGALIFIQVYTLIQAVLGQFLPFAGIGILS